ncbi:MAG TPA: SDR family NAD(P)-dependent oxidoreductase [Steroidobacteraceae bacterium]
MRPVAVVTGGSSGIGAAFVAALHEAGWMVATCGRDRARLEQLAQRHPGVQIHVCDVADRDSVARFARELLAGVTAVDLLVNNAGGLSEIDFTRADLAAMDLTADLRVNLEGAINVTAALLPALKAAPRADLVMVTSGYALAPATRAPVYSAAKSGLRSFTKALRRQLRSSTIAVTEVVPPLVDTPAVAHRKGPKISAQQVVAETLAALRAQRLEVYPGRARLLPLLLRLAPRRIEEVLART